jgi:uncharacterized membrane protein YfcA
MEISSIIFFLLIVTLAGAIPQIVGFGVATISMVLLSFIFPLPILLPLVAVLSTLSTGALLFKKNIFSVFNKVMPLLVGSLVGVTLGMIFLSSVSVSFLEFIFSLFLIIFSIFGLFFSNFSLKIKTFLSGVVGFVAGFLASLFNIQGPIVASYVSQDNSLNKVHLRNLIGLYMSFTGFFTIVGHIVAGRFTFFILDLSLISIPFLFLGSYIGSRIFKKISIIFLKRAIYIFIFIAGVVLLFF